MEKAGEHSKSVSMKNNCLVSDYFPKEQRSPTQRALKMVGTAMVASPPPAADIAALIRDEFMELKTSFMTELRNQFKSIIKPLSDRLEEISLSIDVSQKAKKALEKYSQSDQKYRLCILGKTLA